MPISGSSMATSSRSDSMPGSRAKFSAPRRWWVIALVAPLLLFLLVSFVAPVLLMLSRAVTDRELQTVWPESAAALRQWDDGGLPPDALAQSVAREMVATRQAGTLNRVANRLNYDVAGSRTLLYGTAERLFAGAPGHSVAAQAETDARWGKRDIWSAMRHADGPLNRERKRGS